MARSRKPRFVTSTLEDYKSRAALVLEDSTIDDAEKKTLLNKIRRECMAENAYYSREREALDHFIKSQLKKHEEASQSVTALSQRK